MEKISCVVITHNEEKNIERCLNSLSPVVDEIIIVDSFSTDSTEKICSKFNNVQFYKRKFDGYSPQKNWALQKASFPLVLSLDADEALSDGLADSILQVKKERNFDAYFCNRLNSYCGTWIRHGGWYPDKKLRLWDLRKGQWDDAIIHEKVSMQDEVKYGYLKGDLLHYSYYSISEHIQQTNRFSEMTAQYAIDNQKRSSVSQVIVRPLWKFFRDYFLKAGFRDGYYGFIVAIISSFATFLKYSKMIELQKNQK